MVVIDSLILSNDIVTPLCDTISLVHWLYGFTVYDTYIFVYVYFIFIFNLFLDLKKTAVVGVATPGLPGGPGPNQANNVGTPNPNQSVPGGNQPGAANNVVGQGYTKMFYHRNRVKPICYRNN